MIWSEEIPILILKSKSKGCLCSRWHCMFRHSYRVLICHSQLFTTSLNSCNSRTFKGVNKELLDLKLNRALFEEFLVISFQTMNHHEFFFFLKLSRALFELIVSEFTGFHKCHFRILSIKILQKWGKFFYGIFYMGVFVNVTMDQVILCERAK